MPSGIGAQTVDNKWVLQMAVTNNCLVRLTARANMTQKESYIILNLKRTSAFIILTM
jgi:hypothetical protein